AEESKCGGGGFRRGRRNSRGGATGWVGVEWARDNIGESV
ncbi:hypothetical protein TIFTF001_049869, partial [Ficus carica]